MVSKKIESDLAAVKKEQKRQGDMLAKLVRHQTIDPYVTINEGTEELSELKKLESIERSIQKKVQVSPLKRITYRDITKGMVGAFFGVVGHFSFADSVWITHHHSYIRSTILLLVSFILAVLFIYFTGFRKVQDRFVLKFLPLRAVVIWIASIVTIILVLILYDTVSFSMGFKTLYSTIAGISVLAVLGAGTADLIGRD